MAYISPLYQERLNICGKDLPESGAIRHQRPQVVWCLAKPLVEKARCWQVRENRDFGVKSDQAPVRSTKDLSAFSYE